MGEYMGTHPIFESDFDCLTECSNWSKLALVRSLRPFVPKRFFSRLVSRQLVCDLSRLRQKLSRKFQTEFSIVSPALTKLILRNSVSMPDLTKILDSTHLTLLRSP